MSDDQTTDPPRPPSGDWLGTPFLRFERHEPFAHVVVDRPEARNAMSAAMYFGVRYAVKLADNDPDLFGVLITGTGDVFIPGGDLGTSTSACSSGSRSTTASAGPRRPRASWRSGSGDHRTGCPTSCAAAAGSSRTGDVVAAATVCTDFFRSTCGAVPSRLLPPEFELRSGGSTMEHGAGSPILLGTRVIDPEEERRAHLVSDRP